MGLVSAVVEMLVQCHIPGTLLLLPALPRALAREGVVRGLGSRGSMLVSLSWREGLVVAASVTVTAFHPWNAPTQTGKGGMVQDSPGYFSWSRGWSDAGKSSILVAATSTLRVHSSTQNCVEVGGYESMPLDGIPGGITRSGLRVRITAVPCQINFCLQDIHNSICLLELEKLTSL